MKRILAMALAATMLLSGCAPTKGSTGSTSSAGTTGSNGIPIRLLFMSSNEEIGNVVRDQLSKAGFEVTLNMQPDYSSYKAQLQADNYDVDISGWTTVTGNPDYAVRSLFKTGGDYNQNPVADPKVDEYIEKAATETPEEFKKTYAEFEKYLVDEQAYIVPLALGAKPQAVALKRVKPESVIHSKSRSMTWEQIQFVDGIDPETETLRLTQTGSTLTSFDPPKGNDGSINMLNTQMYVRLVNLTPDDKVVSDGSLSYNYAIADGNENYYFVLRDDINFARVKDGHAVDSKVRVGAEDVVFSMNRAKDPKSVPNHKTYSLHESMETISIVTDLKELDTVMDSNTGKPIKETLEKGIAKPITALEADKTKVDNAAGKYQVVKIKTNKPFPQVLNYLAHQSAGIVDAEVIKSINTYDVEKFDIKKDICYGDQSTVTEGTTYNNTLSCSGPYIAIKKNDYEITFERNPAYMPKTENFGKIKNISVKFIADNDSALSSLRAGEVDALYTVPEKSFDVVKSDANIKFQVIPSNGVTYMTFNMAEGALCSNQLVRKAISAAINPDELLAVFAGTKYPCYSTLGQMVDTGNKFTFEAGKSQKLVEEYKASVAK